jgi:hypothetical protein
MDRDTTLQDELALNFTDFIIAPYFFALTAVLPQLAEAVAVIERNRGVWHGMLMARLRSAPPEDAQALEESLCKWEKREKLFLEAVSPVVKLAAEKKDREGGSQ